MVTMLQLRNEVLRVLREEGPRDEERIVAQTLFSRSYVRSVLGRLHEEGLITCDAKGVYSAN
jgi:DNA-binding GntR family transcriptional regulator